MNDVREVVEFLFSQKNPWAVVLVALGASVFLWKVIREVASLGHTVKEKKLAMLLPYIDGGIENKPRFSVEQVFQHHYGRLFRYEEIKCFLTSVSPSGIIQDYLWARNYVHFDKKTMKIVLRKKINFRLRTSAFYTVFALFYLLMFLAAVSIVIATTSKAETAPIFESFVVLTASAGVCWTSISEIRALNATRRLVELDRAEVMRNSRIGSRTKQVHDV